MMPLDARDLVQPGAAPLLLNQRERFGFTEGPTWDNQDALYFSDGPTDTTRRLSADGSFEVFRSETRGGNGMALAHDGRLLVCEGAGNRISVVDIDTRAVDTVVADYNGAPLNAPNDLALDRSGGIYFTDPFFPAAGQRLVQDAEAVYYLPPNGELNRAPNGEPNRAPNGLVRVWDGVTKPNGIVLTPDEGTLLVADSFGRYVWAIELAAPGMMARASEWGELAVPKAAYVAGDGGRPMLLEGYPEATIADGMALDVEGRLFVTTQQGIQVLSDGGELLGTIEFPEQPANCAFGGEDLRTLFATAQTSVYALAMRTPGLQLPLS